jgi:hypothetical protein
MEHILLELLKEKNIESFIDTVKNNIPHHTSIYLNQQYDKDIGNTPATLHDVMYCDKPIPIILFSYGFIYLGSTWMIPKWKVIWFENIKAVNIIEVNGLRVEISGVNPEKPDKSFVLTPYKEFGIFICKLEAFLRFFSQIPNIPHKLFSGKEHCGLIHGGRRKTKRSKHTRRNKKCKRRTRRS